MLDGKGGRFTGEQVFSMVFESVEFVFWRQRRGQEAIWDWHQLSVIHSLVSGHFMTLRRGDYALLVAMGTLFGSTV